MSWFKKSVEKKEANVSDLLAKDEYLNDFVAAQQKVEAALGDNPMLAKIEKCAELQKHLLECAQTGQTSDPKCLLLHQSWIICAGSQVTPQLFKLFSACASRNKTRPEACENEYQTMWSGVVAELQKADREATKNLLSESEQEVLLDCKLYKEEADNASNKQSQDKGLENWMRCVVPVVCPQQWQQYTTCFNKNDGQVGKCIEDGRPLMICLSDFTVRYARSQH